jgi:hypothetical protein
MTKDDRRWNETKKYGDREVARMSAEIARSIAEVEAGRVVEGETLLADLKRRLNEYFKK